MARIDWAVVCERAFFDQQQRLCVIGVITAFHVPVVPMVMEQVMVVAHLTDIAPVEELAVSIAVQTPSGILSTPTRADSLAIEMRGPYLLATLRALPLMEEGGHGFVASLGDELPTTIHIPVVAAQPPAPADVH